MISKRMTRVVDTLLKQHGAMILFFHVALTFTSLVIAWLLRFDFSLKNRALLLSVAPILVLFRLVAAGRYKLLHGNWRYTGVDDATEIVKATALGSIGFFVTVRLLLHVVSFPLSVYVIEAILSAVLVGGSRLGFRVLAEAASRVPPGHARKQVVIVGGGFAAQMIIRELGHEDSQYWVVGCVDDDKRKTGAKVQGKPVLGTVDQLPQIVAERGIDQIVIAVPSATGAEMRRFLQICGNTGIKSSTVPALQDLLSGKAKINELRDINLDDLLGREPIHLDLNAVRDVLTGKIVMVTGAAGSIGSELCRQILEYQPAKLVCLDQNETGLFYLQMELARTAEAQRATYCVADYTDPDRIQRVFANHRVQIVFHAAAYKHVPLMEQNPREALQNNVFGLLRLMEVAKMAQCESFVLISSDKAVNPSSVMGCTKRIGELILASFPSVQMKCVSVRFGNVLGSQGSVVPIFQKQLQEDQSITVTHPEITRFFMTIREAVSLVLQGAALGGHGDILVLDMGEPVRIVDLARTLIRLSGKAESDIEIVFTGLRPGEKLYEELFYADEVTHDTTCEKIKRTCGTILSWAELKSRLDGLRAMMFSVSDAELRLNIQLVVPQYRSPVQEPVVVRLPPIHFGGESWHSTREQNLEVESTD